MGNRLRIIGLVLALAGLGFMVAGVVAYTRVQEAYGALEDFSAAENVTLSYNDAGELTDRGTTEGAQAILSLLEDDWGYPVNYNELDPNDPVVNSSSEYMYQMATITYHTLHGTQTVVLTEDEYYDVDGDGTDEYFPAGEYQFAVDGRYWTDFDRMHPIEGPAREQAWSGTVHGLVAELGVGTVTHTALQLGLSVAAIFGSIGFVSLLAGIGLFWVGSKDRVPGRIPEEMVEKVKEEDRKKEAGV